MRRSTQRLGMAILGVGLTLACSDVVHPALNRHQSSGECGACHQPDFQRWRGTLHAATAAAVLTNEEHNTTEQLTDECIQCHAPFEGSRYHVGDFVQPVDTIGPWRIVNVRDWEGIKCESCHDLTSSAPQSLAHYDPTTGAYVAVKDATELCEKCHQPGTDDSRDLTGSVHEGLQCTDCHFVTGSEHSLDPTDACSRCHPAVSPGHPDVTKLETTYARANSPNNIHFISCATCHSWALP